MRHYLWTRDNFEHNKNLKYEWAKNNRDKVNTTHRKWYHNNIDKSCSHGITLRRRRRQLYRGYYRDEKSNYKEQCYAKAAKRRAVKLDQTPELSINEKKKIELLYKISNMLGSGWHVDHKITLSQGGLHHPSNLWVIPRKDNLSKGGDSEYELPHDMYFDIE